ncbi:AMP-activated serine/threonine-protein kinase regulatory subunit [Fusarium torreyae]|uniref:AMP-activated serine/threonine-protein kinase regulatory subunit n=1 Tax=Fusarium torreyae TaxID=1237075 RepID=A0A9W8RSY8_9HYPO|nr:AMP-activated serine/threonine-protein kinase regulatory subunit [Fusarium torreyae]
MEGNPEPESVRGEAEAKAPADVDLPSEPQGCQGHIEVTDEAQVEDTAKANVQSWIESQSETQPQQPPPSEPPTDDAEGDDAVGELPRVEADAPSTAPVVTGTTGASTTTSALSGTGAGAPAAEAGVGVGVGAGAGPALITPRGRAASTSTAGSGPSTVVGHGHVPQFVAPSSYLRRRTSIRSPMAPTEPKPLSPLDRDQLQGLNAIRDFLKVRTSYDVLPLSFRLIVLDTDLLIKKAINILTQNAIVSAPLWNSKTSRFAGILTSTDFINVIQYYWQFPDEFHKLDQFRLSSLRDIEKAIGAIPIETVSVHPSKPLYEACRRMLKTRARRIPLIDVDSETNKEMVVSVITQYRILKFIAVNNEHNTVLLKKTVRDIGLGTYSGIATAYMSSSVLDVVHLMVKHNISCVPIIDSHGRVLNVFEAVDVIPCIKGGAYEDLDGSVGEALCKRSDESPGIYTCSEGDRLDSIFDTIRKSRVHRLIVVDDDNKLKGILSLSDILKYVLLYGVEDTSSWA